MEAGTLVNAVVAMDARQPVSRCSVRAVHLVTTSLRRSRAWGGGGCRVLTAGDMFIMARRTTDKQPRAES